MHLCRLPLVALLVVVMAAPAALSHEGRPFGPWDAGEVRAVTRAGKEGRARREHPVVGDAAKVPASGPPPPPLRVDVDLPEFALTRGNEVGGALSANPLYLAALFYSGFLTKVDGPRCQHYPTCSRFANQAVARHGLVGVFLGLERVIADENSSSVRRLPELDMPREPQPRYFDPVDNYEFWIPGKLSAFPEATPEEPLELTPESASRGDKAGDADDAGDVAGDASHDDAPSQLRTKRLPKCENARTLRAPDDGDDVEDRCAPERS